MTVGLRYFTYVILVVTPLIGFSQKELPKKRVGSSILDDSTKSVYGPNTTKWIAEQDIFFNRNKYQAIDTSILNYHRWTYVQRFNNFYKDLGNNGTALNPIFPLMPSQIGITSGFNSYELYYLTEEPRYFDTKSPYTRIQIIWGGNGRSMTRVEFSRNISSRWNFGFNYRPILTDKQIQKQRKGDRHVISHYYDFHTSYRSKDEKYSVYANFRRIRHRVRDNGGIDISGTQLPNGVFDKNAKAFLSQGSQYAQYPNETSELRTNLHLFHQYKIGKALQVYHIVDKTKQRNGLNHLAGDSVYYDYQAYKYDTTFDRTWIKTFQNEVGVKGNLSRLFYNFYYKIRKYDLMNNQFLELAPTGETYGEGIKFKGTENYLGGRMEFALDSVTRITGWAEYLKDNTGGNYRIEGNLNTPWLDASLKNLLSKPGFMQTFYRGAHDYWKNFTFTNSNSLQATGFLKGKLGPLFISPGFSYTLLSKYIFFKEDETRTADKVRPIQSSGIQNVFSPEIKMELALWKRVYFRPQVIYTRLLSNADDALSIPKLFVNGQLTYEGFLFKKNLMAQIGVEVHWQSDYYAKGYDVATQQFYIQNTEVMKAYPLTDLFLSGKIKRGKFFIKYNNLTQLFTNVGYLPTAGGYPGQRNILDFGFELLLFE
jgi:hypothetical protein